MFLPLFFLCLLVVRARDALAAYGEGTQPWVQYTDVSVSKGYNNSFLLIADNTTTTFNMSLMLCEDEYETDTEICCVVGA